MLHERAPEVALVREARPRGDLRDRRLVGEQRLGGPLDAQAANVRPHRDAEACPKRPHEMCLVNASHDGELGQRHSLEDVRVQVVDDVVQPALRRSARRRPRATDDREELERGRVQRERRPPRPPQRARPRGGGRARRASATRSGASRSEATSSARLPPAEGARRPAPVHRADRIDRHAGRRRGSWRRRRARGCAHAPASPWRRRLRARASHSRARAHAGSP